MYDLDYETVIILYKKIKKNYDSEFLINLMLNYKIEKKLD